MKSIIIQRGNCLMSNDIKLVTLDNYSWPISFINVIYRYYTANDQMMFGHLQVIIKKKPKSQQSPENCIFPQDVSIVIK